MLSRHFLGTLPCSKHIIVTMGSWWWWCDVSSFVGWLEIGLIGVFIFVVTMKSSCNFAMLPPFSCNPTFELWQRLGSSGIPKEMLLEFLKLVEISIMITLGSIKDEWTFLTLTYINNKLKNHLTIHLDMVIRMYA